MILDLNEINPDISKKETFKRIYKITRKQCNDYHIGDKITIK